jgi:hypothetical protein
MHVRVQTATYNRRTAPDDPLKNQRSQAPTVSVKAKPARSHGLGNWRRRDCLVLLPIAPDCGAFPSDMYEVTKSGFAARTTSQLLSQ